MSEKYHYNGKCEICGKALTIPYVKNWAYKTKHKDSPHYACSWTCYRKMKAMYAEIRKGAEA